MTPQPIGIVACSAEGAALCYRSICAEGGGLLGPHHHPEVSLHGHSLSEYSDLLGRDDWGGVAHLMLASAYKLAISGAGFLICPDNTIHQALPLIERWSPLPWLHIADAVLDEAEQQGFTRIGLLGTRWLVDGPVYRDKAEARGIELVIPTGPDKLEISRIIMDELVCGVFKPEAVSYHQGVIARLQERGAQAVILGCTEIPLIVDDSISSLPTLDSTRLLAHAALRRSVQGPSVSPTPA